MPCFPATVRWMYWYLFNLSALHADFSCSTTSPWVFCAFKVLPVFHSKQKGSKALFQLKTNKKKKKQTHCGQLYLCKCSALWCSDHVQMTVSEHTPQQQSVRLEFHLNGNQWQEVRNWCRHFSFQHFNDTVTCQNMTLCFMFRATFQWWMFCPAFLPLLT